MKILLIHNRYKQAGGEDSVFQSEKTLLKRFGHTVDELIFDNSLINSFIAKCLSGVRAIYNPHSARLVRNKIREFQPDVIHVHNFLPLASPSVFIEARKSAIPVVFTLHNYRMICPSATLFFDGHIYEKSAHSYFPFDAVWKGVYRQSKVQTAVVGLMVLFHRLIGTWKNDISGYIALTKFARNKFENSMLQIPSSKLFIKPNFVEDVGNGNAERDDFFLFVGRLTEEKGINTLINASSLHDFKLVIIGDGGMKKMVEDAVMQNSNITFLGFQTRPVIMNYIKKCKALIFPSIWYEGFPVTIAEALSAGTPVIASDLGSMAEIIKNKVNGLLFKPGNEQDLVEKIMKISREDGLARKLSDNARQDYLEHYTPEKNYLMLLNIYNAVIERQKALNKKVAGTEKSSVGIINPAPMLPRTETHYQSRM